VLDLDRIRSGLSEYLETRVAHLKVLASGWETTVFEFSLSERSTRFPSIPAARPMVLRFYQGAFADAKGQREHYTMTRLAEAGYCVPRPYLFELAHDALGAPFLVMERVAGGPLFAARSFPQAFKTFSLGFFAFVRAQARLHRLDPGPSGLAGIPRACAAAGGSISAPLLDRVLAVIGERVENGPLPGLRPALASLLARAARFRDAPSSVVHMDYHPQNVMVSGVRVTGVIDWVNTDIGDRHLDAAMTAAILSSSAMEHPRWMRDNAVGNMLRAAFTSLYIPLYHAMAPVDFERFRYCQAVASLLRLSMLGMMRTRGPETVGFRPEALCEVTPAVVRLLSRYASRKSGAAVGLEMSASPA
jgi:aminoglycoside phosphotransferase (APT) family kinase protein